ncbi:hypothetical protein AGLY_005870 [Aphis glycines]|uniref:Uncharacterized protein n=1 Tax=Aphis glycines TaxID=307491 RepID=A0A6G0TS51_APHGL|nr:hypothetical protein AGLY_005870 [Aphis glycines]
MVPWSGRKVCMLTEVSANCTVAVTVLHIKKYMHQNLTPNKSSSKSSLVWNRNIEYNAIKESFQSYLINCLSFKCTTKDYIHSVRNQKLSICSLIFSRVIYPFVTATFGLYTSGVHSTTTTEVVWRREGFMRWSTLLAEIGMGNTYSLGIITIQLYHYFKSVSYFYLTSIFVYTNNNQLAHDNITLHNTYLLLYIFNTSFIYMTV